MSPMSKVRQLRESRRTKQAAAPKPLFEPDVLDQDDEDEEDSGDDELVKAF